jgi:poly-gamma-glutamate synthesis protein (capsule biosynthesis protein)
VQKSFQFLLFLIGILGMISACSSQTGMVSTELSASTASNGEDIPPATKTLTPFPTAAITSTSTMIPSVTPIPRTVIAFTGVIVPARCVQAEIDRQGHADYLYDEVREILKGADITVGVYNATMSDQIEYVGCENSWELVGSPNNADALQRAGFDVISVATNHIKDCGKKFCGNVAFFDTLHHLERVGIHSVGAGQDLMEAIRPVVLNINGVRFGFVSLGEVNERVFADAITPGIAVLTRGNLVSAISEAQAISDVVVVLPHSGPEDYPEVTPQQKYWARNAVEAGADLVVTTHAHIVQGYQLLDGVPVFYSLGNFVFDQIWARDHQQGVILLVTFERETIVNFELIPTVVDQDGTVHLAGVQEKNEILARIDDLNKELGPAN